MTNSRPETGPEMFLCSHVEVDAAFPTQSHLTDAEQQTSLLSALVTATQAQVAATVLLTEVIAAAADVTSPDLDAWRKVIPVDFSAWKKES